jgi:hypothetical protein
VLIPLGERDGAVRIAEQRAGCALLAMTVDEGLSGREAADWCGSGVTVREVTRPRRIVHPDSGRVHGEGAARKCSGSMAHRMLRSERGYVIGSVTSWRSLGRFHRLPDAHVLEHARPYLPLSSGASAGSVQG